MVRRAAGRMAGVILFVVTLGPTFAGCGDDEPTLRDRMIRCAEMRPRSGVYQPAMSCDEAASVIMSRPRAVLSLDPAGHEVGVDGIEITGDRAVVFFVTSNGRSGFIKATRRDGRWTADGDG